MLEPEASTRERLSAQTERAAFVVNEAGFTIEVEPDDPRGAALAASRGDLNPISLQIWAGLLAGGDWDVVVDVGANYGEMLLGGELPAGALVVAFEPNPSVRTRLVRNLAQLRSRVQIDPRAVADFPGHETLLIDRMWSGTTRLGAPGAPGECLDPVVVPVTTLDSSLGRTAARSAAIKIDVEGLSCGYSPVRQRGLRAWTASPALSRSSTWTPMSLPAFRGSTPCTCGTSGHDAPCVSPALRTPPSSTASGPPASSTNRTPSC